MVDFLFLTPYDIKRVNIDPKLYNYQKKTAVVII